MINRMVKVNFKSGSVIFAVLSSFMQVMS